MQSGAQLCGCPLIISLFFSTDSYHTNNLFPKGRVPLYCHAQLHNFEKKKKKFVKLKNK